VSAMSQQTHTPNPPRVVAVFTGVPGYAMERAEEPVVIAITATRLPAERSEPDLVAA
jgi:hypothetical protein